MEVKRFQDMAWEVVTAYVVACFKSCSKRGILDPLGTLSGRKLRPSIPPAYEILARPISEHKKSLN